MSTPTPVRALFIGINEYREDIPLFQQAVFPRLAGCVADVQNVHDCLKTMPGIELNAKMLTDEQATKKAIVEQFEDFLGAAGPEEAILIYYSGHGTVEDADPEVWTTETDGRLESLVCYYDQQESSGRFLLADKELRFLLYQLSERTGAHITAIFDCCHSGDNTRAIMQAITQPQNQPRLIQRRSYDGLVFPKRPWKEFVFSRYLKAADFVGQGIDQVLPPGRYIQLAAAESNESALEENGSGVFTSALLNVLRQSGGVVTYRDLHSRVCNHLRHRYEQRPKIYTPVRDGGLTMSGFLNRPVGEAARWATLTYNANVGYLINRGAAFGVSADQTRVLVDVGEGRTVEGQVTLADLESSRVTFPPDVHGLLARREWPARLEGLQTRPLRIHLINKDQPPAVIDPLLDRLTQAENAEVLVLENDEQAADYTLLLWHDLAYLTMPGERFRPLVQALSTESPTLADDLLRFLRQMARQTFLAELRNKSTDGLSPDALQVEVFQVEPDGEKPAEVVDNEVSLDLLRDADGEWSRRIRIRLTNRTARDLYVGAVIHSFDFSSETGYLLDPRVTMLEAGESKWLRDYEDGLVELHLDERCYWYNWPKSTDRVQFIYGTEAFDTVSFQLEALPAPAIPDKDRTISRGSFGRKPKTPKRGWNTAMLQFTVLNPLYDQLRKEDIEGMLREEELAHFALGLYFQPLDSPYSNRQLMLKPEVLTAAERSIVWDATLTVANRWANFWRNRRYERMAKQYPDLPKIVSEGDSWFQHPLLTDIIDNVGNVYPTYCLAAAGDTIANYVRGGEFQTEVQRIGPKYFLLSGGGNDILGEEMRKFLAKEFAEAEEGREIDRFFTTELQQALERVLENYRQMIDALALNYPDLRIVLHGYDYPRPLPSGQNKGWFGRYLDEVSITRQGDREAISTYLIDTFNEKLRQLAEAYPGRVYYLNLRKMVGEQEWDDEIHPNNEGFSRVSRRFLEQLAVLR